MIKRFVFYWLPPLLWMTLIFLLSSRTRISVDDTYIVNFIIFKTLHVIEYGALYFLLSRAFLNLKNPSLGKHQRLIFPFFISVLYAISDEVHQSFVPTREGTLRDVIIDTIGIYIAYIYIRHRPSK